MDAVPGAGRGIARRLLSPPQELTLEELAEAWAHTVTVWRCSGKGHLADDLSAPNKIRGAWGRAMMRSASAEALDGKPCPWEPPCALHVLMGDHGGAGRGLHFPKPFVIQLESDGPNLLVCLTLFGFANDWRAAAVEAMTAALREGVKIPGRMETLEPVGIAMEAHAGLCLPPETGAAHLMFRTPVQLRSGTALHGSLAALVSSLGNRVSGLGRWQGVLVSADWRGIKQAAAGLDIEVRAAQPAVWRRKARRGGDHALPGLLLSLRISGDLTPVLPLLVIGQTCHAGSHAALGMGRYDLSFEAPEISSTLWNFDNYLNFDNEVYRSGQN
ncbi:MAG: hypothetical protein RLO01_13465 [Thalassobaculaceae bacterium]